MSEINSSIPEKHLIVSGEFKNLRKIRDFIMKSSKQAGFEEEETYKIQLAVDEACSNIIQHAYGGENRGEIKCYCSYTNENFIILLQDNGNSFDIDSVISPDIKTDLENRLVGGLGVYFIRQLMDQVVYKSVPDPDDPDNNPVVNQLFLIKRRRDK